MRILLTFILLLIASLAQGETYSGGSSSTTTYPIFNVKNYGAVANVLTLTNVTTTSGSATVSSPSYTFTSADVGKEVYLSNGSSTSTPFKSYISSISGSNAVLANNVLSSHAGTTTMEFGTDSTAAIQSAITAAEAAITAGSYGAQVYIPGGIYAVSSLVPASGITIMGDGPNATVLRYLNRAYQTAGIILMTSTHTDVTYQNFQVDGSVALVNGYTTSEKGFDEKSGTRVSFVNVYVYGTQATGFGADYETQCSFVNCNATGCGRGNPGTSGGGSGFGFGVEGQASGSIPNSYTLTNCQAINNVRNGIFFEGEGTLGNYALVSVVNCSFYMNATSGYGFSDAGGANCVVTGCTFFGISGCLDAISVNAGTVNIAIPGIRGVFANNHVLGCQNGISINYGTRPSTSDADYIITGNNIQSVLGVGILCTASSTQAVNTLLISGNVIDAAPSDGIQFTGSSGFTNISLKNNIIKNGAANGIEIDCPISNLDMQGNDIFDSQTSHTQTNGLLVTGSGSTVTNALIQNNTFSNNVTAAISATSSGTIAGNIQNNLGYDTITAAPAMVLGVSTVSLPRVNSSTDILLNDNVIGGTPGALFVFSKTAGTGFVIHSTSTTDTGTPSYTTVEHAIP